MISSKKARTEMVILLNLTSVATALADTFNTSSFVEPAVRIAWPLTEAKRPVLFTVYFGI